jgi:Tfp pilus assembly protein PilX
MNKLPFAKLSLRRDKRGMVLITTLLIFLLLTFLALSLADLTIAQHGRTARNVSVANSLLTAEAGIEQSLYEINEDSNYAGVTETEFFNNETQGRGTYQSTVTAGSGPNEKVITSTGRVYPHNQTTDPISERKVRVTVVGTSTVTPSVISGAGGLILNGSASITNSDVRVNGYIDLNGASKIGTQAQPVSVEVAHQNCPTGSNPGPTFPQYCTSGQPITMDWSTAIYGTVCARNQTSTGPNNNIKTGNGGQGLLANCVNDPDAPDAQPLPEYDRAAHIAAVTTTGSATNVTYNCSQWMSGQGFNRTWPANLQLNGNVNAASSCNLIVSGDVYITGNLTIGGNARIRVAEGLTEPPVIIVDGDIDVGGSAALIPNSNGTSMHFISFKSSASCSPSCASVTGTDLYNSQNLTTVDVAGAGSFPGAIFQAYWSKIEMGGSGTTGSAIGQTIELNGAGTITFGTSLSSGELTWTVRSYQQDFN